MKFLNPSLLRWILALSLLCVCNLYGQPNPIFETGSGGGGTVAEMGPGFTPLPVKLLYFKAVPQDDYVVLTWATATESGNSHFVVERSSEGRRFEALHEIDAAGNSLTPLGYRTVDDMPGTGRSYYRLKQVDYNGSFSYSPVVSVYSSGMGKLSLYPTIASSFVHIALKAEFLPETMTLRVVDAAGRVADFMQISAGEDISHKEVTLPVSSLTQGIYLLQVEGYNGFYLQERFIVQ